MIEFVTMADSATLVVLGASGDLTRRLLLPALGEVLRTQPGRRVTLVGAASDAVDADQWRHLVAAALARCPADARGELLATTRYAELDATDAADLGRLLGAVKSPTLLYLALPPRVSQAVCGALGTLPLPDDLSIAIEKPFGTDAASAVAFNRPLAGLLPAERVFRVDHFMAFLLLRLHRRPGRRRGMLAHRHPVHRRPAR